MKLTDAEVAYLLKLPDVVNRLARFNRAQAIQSADAGTRMDLLARVRTFERMERDK